MERGDSQSILCLSTRAFVNRCQTGIYYIDTILPFRFRVMRSLIIMNILDIEGTTDKKEGGQDGEKPWREI